MSGRLGAVRRCLLRLLPWRVNLLSLGIDSQPLVKPMTRDAVAIYWHCSHGNGEWHWATDDLGNGWIAMVSDTSQADTNRDQRTAYTVKAVCKSRRTVIREVQESSFEAAKMEALRLAITQDAVK